MLHQGQQRRLVGQRRGERIDQLAMIRRCLDDFVQRLRGWRKHLGLGAQPPTAEWGAMLSAGREFMRYAPWTMIFPGLALFLAVMSVNLVGDRLSHILDPRASGRV